MTRKYDFTVFGATGITGMQFIRHLVQHCAADLRSWAIAGRNRYKLERLARQLPDGIVAPDVVIADSDDPASIEAMVRDTHVLAHLAGPYAPRGEACVAACVEHATDYLDLNAETFFMRRLIDSYHERAAKRGVKIVPSCGYEALPFDISALAIVRQLRERFDTECDEVDITAASEGIAPRRVADVLSSGTWGSVRSLLELDTSHTLRDPASLLTDPDDAAAVRARNPYELDARYDSQAGTWLFPAVPVPFLTPAVVHRSRALYATNRFHYGKRFVYRERMSSRRAPVFSPAGAAAVVTSVGFKGFAQLLDSERRWPRVALSKVIATLAPPGAGPSEAAMEGMSYRLRLQGRGASGATVSGELVGRGHAGYRSTGAMIAEATLALAYRRDATPLIFGILTPASALGMALQDYLPRAQIAFSLDAAPAS